MYIVDIKKDHISTGNRPNNELCPDKQYQPFMNFMTNTKQLYRLSVDFFNVCSVNCAVLHNKLTIASMVSRAYRCHSIALAH